MRTTIVRTNFWKEVNEKLKNPIEYGLQTLRGKENIRCCQLGRDWMTNVFSAADIEKMKPWTPLFIVAQTGTGKTTMIFKRLIPLACKERRKILYIAGRVALTTQIKEIAMSDELNRELQGDYMSVKEMKKEYSAGMIKKCSNFGAIDIFTYQEILSKIGMIDFSSYSAVVFDEAHFFVSDATFNPFTEEILNRLIEKTQVTRRIYLTATPDECIEDIYEKEKSYLENVIRRPSELQVYVMDEDYSYIRPYFFDKKDWLIKKIYNSSSNDKWLIFVREKSTGEYLLDKLSDMSDEVAFMTADTDRESDEYQEIIRSEKLPKRILITTKFLDVGVNIKTEGLHVVIFDDDFVEMKQMLGRKRVKEGEHVEVLFYIPSYGELNQRLGYTSKVMQNEQQIVDGIDESSADVYYENLPHPLFAHGASVKYNSLSLRKHEVDLCRYLELLRSLDAYKDKPAEYQERYKQLILDHFPGVDSELCSTVNLDDESYEQVMKLINQYTNRTLSKEDREEFSEKLTEIVGDHRKDTRKDRGVMGVSSLNNVLTLYGHQIESHNNANPVTYRLVRTGGRS